MVRYLSSWGWFVVAGAFLGGRDMCLGGGKRPHPEPPPSSPPAQTAPPRQGATATPTFATPPPPLPPG